MSWNVYDRLVTFANKPGEDGTATFDYFDIQPELAESYEVSEDKRSITSTSARTRRSTTARRSPPTTSNGLWTASSRARSGARSSAPAR